MKFIQAIIHNGWISLVLAALLLICHGLVHYWDVMQPHDIDIFVNNRCRFQGGRQQLEWDIYISHDYITIEQLEWDIYISHDYIKIEQLEWDILSHDYITTDVIYTFSIQSTISHILSILSGVKTVEQLYIIKYTYTLLSNILFMYYHYALYNQQ